MRDYVAWYLVELRRRLRGVEPQSRVEDFLLETKTHLHESIEDMTSRGIPEEAAIKSAIADFGEPTLVSSSFKGKGLISRGAYWVSVAFICLVGVYVLGALALRSTDNALGHGSVTSFDFGLVTAVVIGGLGLVGFLSRRWCVVPVAIVGFFAVLVFSTWVRSTTDAYAMKDGSDRFVLLSKGVAEAQVELRKDWLQDYEERIPPLANLLSDPSQAAEGALLEFVEVSPGTYEYPTLSDNRFAGIYYSLPPAIVGSKNQWNGNYGYHWVPIDEANNKTAYVSHTPVKEQAVTAWRESGQGYLAALAHEKQRVEREMARFSSPARVDASKVTQRLVWFPMMVFGLYALLGLLSNAAGIIAAASVKSVRLRRWRRLIN